jgi:arginyl-tRNA synthetase
MKMTIVEIIKQELAKKLESVGIFEGDIEISLEKPRDRSHGDFSSSVALSSAKKLERNPREIASELATKLEFDDSLISAVEIAGPGFINFRLTNEHKLEQMLALWNGTGAIESIKTGGNKRINIEFISANPTGPLNVVSARAGAFGATLVNLLKATGYDAHAEYYVNDAGRQVMLLGRSLRARFQEIKDLDYDFPEGGYKGKYITAMAEELLGLDGDDIQAASQVFNDESFQRLNAPSGTGVEWLDLPEDESAKHFSKYALMKILTWQRQTCRRFALKFDTWYFESELHESKRIERAYDKLKKNGVTYEQDGAVWFRSSDYGDEKDRVAIRSNGDPTYFLADIAYHYHKFQRGFEHAINFLGPDHHSHIPRMRGAMKALGVPDGWLEVQILQQVNFVEDGKPVDMSKREGQFVSMDALADDVGADVAKYIFLTRKPNSHLDFDLDLAREQSSENPVFYIKYAHARICSVLRKGEEQGLAPGTPNMETLKNLSDEHELALVSELIRLPDVIAGAAKTREPHRLTLYLDDIASHFHQFYHNCVIISDDKETTIARLQLSLVTKVILAKVLDLVGVEAPEYMGDKS